MTVGDKVKAKVVAINRIGASDESEESGEAKIMAAPAEPTLVATSLNAEDNVHVSFIPPSTNGGSPISGYRVFIKTEVSDDYEEVESFIRASDSFVDISSLLIKNDPWHLREGTEVFAKVVAVNEVGEATSAPGGGAFFMIPCEINVAPDAPVDLLEQTVTARTITFTWSDPKCDGNLPIQSYFVHVERFGDQALPDDIYSDDVKEFTIENLKPASTYSISLSARTMNGRSPQSVALSV